MTCPQIKQPLCNRISLEPRPPGYSGCVLGPSARRTFHQVQFLFYFFLGHPRFPFLSLVGQMQFLVEDPFALLYLLFVYLLRTVMGSNSFQFVQ